MQSSFQHLSSDFWFVSVPRRDQGDRGHQNVRQAVERGKLGSCFSLELPDLRIGTLDKLMALSDDLVKHDNFVGIVATKLARQLLELAEDEGAPLDEALNVGNATIDVFMERFRWNVGRWDYAKNSLQTITEEIQRNMTDVDEQLRVRQQDWSQLLHTITAAERGQSGSILLRDLSSLVPKDLFHSEHATSVLVVVPNLETKAWIAQYETFSEYVLPRSASVVASDSEHTLYSVVVLKHFVDDFKAHCREHRYTPRDFDFAGEGDVVKQEDKMARLKTDRADRRNELYKFCKLNFAEAFSGWVHVKCIRTWVESVLRFGLPAHFDVTVIQPSSKGKGKLHGILSSLFSALGSVSKADDFDAPIGLNLGDEVYPYVFQELNLGF